MTELAGESLLENGVVSAAEYEEIRQAAREFTKAEITPIAGEIDREDLSLPENLIRKMASLGYFGLHIPETWGGSGLDVRALVVVTEELCRGLLSAGSVLGRNIITGEKLLKEGTDDQRERYLGLVASGEYQTALAATEPEAGSDAANIQTRAVKDGSRYLLTGTKAFCTFADRADLLFVFARTDPDAHPKHRGISCFIVEKPANKFLPPTLIATRMPTIGYHGLRTFMLYFDQHAVPERNLLGGVPNVGFKQLMKGYETGRITFAARCVGVAEAGFQAALSYSQERIQFDKPISEFQATRFKLAEMATDIAAARQLVWFAAELKDSGKRCDLEAGMAKLFASEVARKQTWHALQIHGGLGFTLDSPVQRFWRDAALLPIAEGTSDVQKEVIARRILEAHHVDS